MVAPLLQEPDIDLETFDADLAKLVPPRLGLNDIWAACESGCLINRSFAHLDRRAKQLGYQLVQISENDREQKVAKSAA